MRSVDNKPIIFISYSHADEPEKTADGEVQWLSFVRNYLRAAEKQGLVEIWTDRLMVGGADFSPDIERKLRACDIFLLLVSPNSMSSNYIVDMEIKIIRERQAQGEAVHFYPLILKPTPKVGLDLVRDKNLRPQGAKALFNYSLNDRYQQMSEVADEIVGLAKEISGRTNRLSSEASDLHGVFSEDHSQEALPRASGVQRQIGDRVALGEWLRQQDRSVAVIIAARAAARAAPFVIRGEGPVGAIADLMGATFRSLAAAASAVRRIPSRVELLAPAIAAAGMAVSVASAVTAFMLNSPTAHGARGPALVAAIVVSAVSAALITPSRGIEAFASVVVMLAFLFNVLGPVFS